MAGFLFSISNDKKSTAFEIIQRICSDGMYATLLGAKWSVATSATLGDYINMMPGDNVYFFSRRVVYGIGEIVSSLENGEAAFELFKDSSSKHSIPPEQYTQTDSEGKIRYKRWAIRIKPSPAFFSYGIDMDDLLRTDPPAFRAVRAFQKKSFVQLDDKENQAFKSALIRKNELALTNGLHKSLSITSSAQLLDLSREELQANLSISPITLNQLLLESRDKAGALGSEMILENGILLALKRKQPDAVKAFGTWDYLSHQVIASPFKPVDYMDRIDIFGYRWVPEYEGEIISKYL